MSRLSRLALVMVLLTLAGCAGRAPLLADAAGVPSEKQVILALREIEASDAQRRAVLAAFDAARPALRALQAEREDLQSALSALSAQSPDHAEQVEALASRWGDLHARELRVFARFEQGVAQALSAAQWAQWRDMTAASPLGGAAGGPGMVVRRR